MFSVAVAASERSHAHSQGARESRANIRWFHVGHDIGDRVCGDLPHSQDGKEISNQDPDVHHDSSNEHVDEVANPHA